MFWVHLPTINYKIIFKFLILTFSFFASLFVFGQESIESLIKKHEIPESKLSIILEEHESGKRLIDINSNRSRSPASVTKLFTAFAAIDLLGSQYQWKTEAYINQKDNGKDSIDYLLIRGGGDPSFSINDLESFILKIRATGIREIRNGIYLDQSFFKQRKNSTGSFDQSPLRPYNTMHSSLIVNSNKLDLGFRFNSKSKQIVITPSFLPTGVSIQSNLLIGSGDCKDFKSQVTFEERLEKKTLMILINGFYPGQCSNFDHDLAITETEHYFFGAFKKIWVDSGGTINGHYKRRKKSKMNALIAHMDSEELNSALRLILKESDNLASRNVFLSFAEKSNQRKLRNIRKTVYRSMKNNDIQWHNRNFIDNGSGLSRKTRLKPESIMGLIKKIDQDIKFLEIKSMLPVSGIDGTLKNIYQSSLLQGQMRLKTGTLNGVRCLAGFITSSSGKNYRFVFMHNNFDEYEYDLRLFTTELLNLIVSEELIASD
ncbi:MAG TPA: D-alanyl-D-alanine carboxypeptidase/D-alanyl-D-alanine-endopeptidase [Gammaproteobacteria bacterium]|nr:D-alanyl-D-alanine carboxypeptidase/D-alanyl-D-alanine-endopeptidase [Gammaproteobacteria bacterium]